MLSHQIPDVISNHDFTPPPLVSLFHYLNALVETFSLFLSNISQVITKKSKWKAKNVISGTCKNQCFNNFLLNITPPLLSLLLCGGQESLLLSCEMLAKHFLDQTLIFVILLMPTFSDLRSNKYATLKLYFREIWKH